MVLYLSPEAEGGITLMLMSWLNLVGEEVNGEDGKVEGSDEKAKGEVMGEILIAG